MITRLIPCWLCRALFAPGAYYVHSLTSGHVAALFARIRGAA
jgi:hypothetical protein